jgi:putative addiction module component (TIGR02574 family)
MTTIVLADIAQLSVSERIQLAEDIWDTIIVTPDELPLPEAQRVEIDRRLQAYLENPQPGASWEDVQQRIRGQR